MNEQFLQYVWFQRLFSPNQVTDDGCSVEIIDVGQRNTDAGPDVFNAKIKIDGTLWAGNVEFHCKASDWLRHGHTTDRAYNSVVLHVVADADVEIRRTDGQKIPQCVLRFPPTLYATYQNLMNQRDFVACARHLPELSGFEAHAWLDSLLVERLEQKTHAVDALLQQTTNDWEEAFYITLARNFGFSVNAAAFELLAKSLPHAFIGKHRSDMLQIEALLFGQAGMLERDDVRDDYFCQLQREYHFLRAKFQLKPLDASLWKWLRLRPANFPTIRLAEFANLIFRSHRLLSQVIETESVDALRSLFDCEVSGYWETHYRFGEPTAKRAKRLSHASIDLLLINSVAPFLFCYGKSRHDERLVQRAMDLLAKLPPERNHIAEGFAAHGLTAESAADTQALVQLKRAYCDVRNCLRCRFAKYALRQVNA